MAPETMQACGFRRNWWTTKEHERAVELRRQGKGYGAIGKTIGRTDNAVAARLRVYGRVEQV